MNQQFMDYGSWMNLLKGNYRKGANALRGILSEAESGAQLAADSAAVMAIYGDVDYSDGSCLAANVIGNTDFAPAAFNHYLNLIGVSDYDTWAESAVDTDVLIAISSDEKLVSVIKNSPKLVVPKRTLSDDSWSQIKQTAENNTYDLVYSVGDTKDVNLSGIGTMTFEIADFNHDYASSELSDKKCAFSFISKNLLYKTYQFNSSKTNSSAYPSTAMVSTLNSVLDAMPADLKSVICTSYKWYAFGNYSSNQNGVISGQKLWIPQEYEFFGSNSFCTEQEHVRGKSSQYPVFFDKSNLMKKLRNGTSGYSAYWASSAVSTNSDSFCTVSSSGSFGHSYADAYNGVCFGFCV